MKFKTPQIAAIIREISGLIQENKEILSELDGRIGDGDLGLTMDKAFRAAEKMLQETDDDDPGKFCMKIGMTIAKVAPSTMGTLLAGGFMSGGKALSGMETLTVSDLSAFFRNFTTSIQQRGKAEPGDKTVLDVLFPVCEALEGYNGPDIAGALRKAESVATLSLENSKSMMSKHGKAAVFREATIGVQDPGCTVAYLIVKGFHRTLVSE